MHLSAQTVNAINQLKIYYQYMRGIRSKLIELYNGLCGSDYDILVFTETWLSLDIVDSEIVSPNYSNFRRDLSNVTSEKSRGGGVCVIVKNELYAFHIHLANSQMEELYVNITSGNTNLIVGAVYIAPLSSLERYDLHYDSLNVLSERYHGVPFYLLATITGPIFTGHQVTMKLI